MLGHKGDGSEKLPHSYKMRGNSDYSGHAREGVVTPGYFGFPYLLIPPAGRKGIIFLH